MTDQQPFSVVQKYGDFELRRYPAHVLVQVDVVGDFNRAGNSGFGPLFRYISGNNTSSEKIAMTAPVIQESANTAEHTVSFVLPAGAEASSVPVPSDARVRITEVPAGVVAARRFGGGWSESRYSQNAEALVESVAKESIQTTGEPYFARFDPPWMPTFLRHNEVLVRIADSTND